MKIKITVTQCHILLSVLYFLMIYHACCDVYIPMTFILSRVLVSELRLLINPAANYRVTDAFVATAPAILS